MVAKGASPLNDFAVRYAPAKSMVAKGDNTPEGLVAVQTNLTSRSGYVGTKRNHRHKDFSSGRTFWSLTCKQVSLHCNKPLRRRVVAPAAS